MRGRFRIIEGDIVDCSFFFRRRAKFINFVAAPKSAAIEELRGDIRNIAEAAAPANENVNVLEFRRDPKRRR
jgi:hypothetical protein